MDEKYLQDLYSWIVSKDPSYQKDITPEAFRQKMSSPEYASKMHSWISTLDPTFQKDMSIDKFNERIGIGKKKVATELPSEGTSLVSSATEKVSVGPMEMVGLERTKEYKPEDGQGWLLNTVSSLDKGFYKNLIGNPIKGLGTLLEGTTAKIIGGTGKAPISDALIRFGDYFNKTIDELAPQDEEFKGSLSDQFAQAFGQVASLVLTGGATGAAGKGAGALGATTKVAPAATGIAAKVAPAIAAGKTFAAELASPVAVSAGLSMGQSEFDRAKQSGATDDQAFEAFWKNAAVGSVLEKVPVMQFFKRFNKATSGGLASYIKTKGVAGLTGGVEEMTTEVLQQIYSNATAKEIYDTNQTLFEGIGESGGVGFGVGFLLNAMGANAKLLRQQGKNEEANIVEAQMQQFDKQAQNGGPSSYKVNGIPIADPKVIEEMIDNMNADDLTASNIDIINDPKLNIKLQDKIVTSSIKEQARQANPNLSEDNLDRVTELEKELRKLEGNTTQIGKDKAAQIRLQIKQIQDVQEQATGEVSIQPRAGVSGEVAQGKPQAEPQGVTEEGKAQEEIPEVEAVETVDVSKGFTDYNPKDLNIGEEVYYSFDGKSYSKGKVVNRPSAAKQNVYTIENENGVPTVIIYGGERTNVTLKKPEGVTEEGKVQEKVVPLVSFDGKPIEDKAQIESISAVFEERIPSIQNIEDAPKVLEGLGVQIPEASQATFNQFIQDRLEGKTQDSFAQWVEKSQAPVVEGPKYVKDISVLITPATVRSFDPATERIKELSLKYDDLVKKYNESKDETIIPQIRELEEQILNDTKQEIVDQVSKVKGAEVKFKDAKMGLWEGKFEPAFNMTLSVTPQADTKALSDMLINFAEKYSQDAFILESDSDDQNSVFNDEIDMPLSESRGDLLYYPQVVFDFNKPITREKMAELSNKLQEQGIEAFNMNENGLKVSVITFLNPEQEQNLSTDEQYKFKQDEYKRQSTATASAVKEILGSDALADGYVKIRRSKYTGAINEKGPEQTRTYDRGDVFEGFQKAPTEVENLVKEYNELRSRQIELSKQKQQLPAVELDRLNELAAFVQPTVEKTFAVNEQMYNEAKTEVEQVAKEAIKGKKAFISGFPIKRPSRASIKTLRWYGGFTEKLGDGARVNVIVENAADADEVFNSIASQYPSQEAELRRVSEETDLGYPKKLIEVRTSNGVIAEIQVMTPQAYLAKDGVKDFVGKQDLAKAELAKVRERLGWNIPDGLGHYFYEIQRDYNVDEDLRQEAMSLSKRYYDAFTKPNAKLDQAFMDEVVAFKDKIDAADKSKWDKGNEGIAPQSLEDYIEQSALAKPQELTEADLPGYDRMMGEIDGIIEKSQNRGVPFNKIMENVMEYMKTSKAYEGATDVQREALVRDIRNRFKKKEKRAPSAKKILGQKKTEVTVDEMAALKDQIRLEARAAREAKGDLNAKRKQLADFIRKMASTGKITVNRVAALVNRIGKVNLDSNESVERLIDYAGKLFADAEYANKLGAATTMRSQIRKLSKNKDKAANLRDLGSKFSEIDPSMVEDIDEYNKVASTIKESIKGSTTRGADVKFADMVKESDAIEYINAAMKDQQKKLFDMKVAEVQELLGVDASELSYDQLMEMLESKEQLTKDNEKLVRSAINKAFNIYSTLIKESMKTGKDLFTGEDVEYTANQKRVVNEFMGMNLSILKPKQALEAVDALMNFFQNQSVAKMESVVSKYRGESEMIAAEKEGVKAKPIRKYWSKGIGRLLIEQTANLNILFERMFRGFAKGGKMEDRTGITAIKNGKSKAQAESNSIVKKYVDKFYKTKPNGKDFNTAANNTERGMVAFMMRNIIGTETEMQAEFERRKNLILKIEDDGTRTGSIAELENGNDVERERAKVYQEVYDKILADSNTIDEVVSKADKTNVEAVNFWQNEWDNKYEELSDVALGVYNKVLGKDINYNPDRFSKLSSDTGDVELSTEDMTFIFNSGNAPIYKKETGVLMTATRPESLPKSEKSGEVNRYVDLSFDSNNSNSMYDALVDINTAAPIRQAEAALNSSAFKRIVPDAADRKLLENRVKLYVNNIRKKNPFSNDEFSKAVKGLNRLASIGVGQALGGVLQPIKQVVPIAMNTLINAGGLDVNSVFNKSKQDFIDKSGYAIASRGVESQAQVNTLNKMINEAANSKPEQAFRAIEKVNNWWLKNLLVRFDVAIARASWMTYYEQSLEKQGINTKGIDYNTHEINDEAADYAQRQVDRQQNVSDADLAGALLSSKDAKTQLFVKILMPFASFRMNQSARVGADLSTLLDKTSTKEDKVIAARSLGGFAAEMVTFRALSAGSALLIAALVKEIMGREDDEEKDKKKIDSIIKGQLTSTVADLFSPAPLLDKAVQMGTSAVLDATQDALDIDEEERLEIYSGNKQDFFQSLGLLGIAGARANQLWEMTKLSVGAPYEDDYGRKKYLTEEDRDTIGTLIPFAIVSNLGLVPSEVNSVIRSSISDAKRSASTVEGGKSREDVKLEGRAGAISEERKVKLEQSKQDKIKALEEIKNDEIDADKIKAIDNMIEELEMTSEEKKATQSEMKKEKIEKAEKMKELLQGYDNKTDMKRYDPRLYEETFGENSEYYLKNKAEMEVDKELNKKIQEMEDEQRGYTPAQKRAAKYRSRLKSFKSKYKRESESFR